MIERFYKWQKEGYEKFKDAIFFMANVCCGGGKTLFAIAISIYKNMPVLIIAPKRICDQWKLDLMDEGVDEKDIWVYNQSAYTNDKTGYTRKAAEWLQS